jgi:tRNA U55 pseudouridine synthase TruB
MNIKKRIDFNGAILLDKSPGMTSFDVLRILKKSFFLTK